MAKKGLLERASKFISNRLQNPDTGNKGGDPEVDKVRKGIVTALKVKSSLPFIWYGIIALLIVFVLLMATGLVSGVAASLKNLSQSNTCENRISSSDIIAEAEKDGTKLSDQDIKDLQEADGGSSCGGLGYNGSTYPPTTGTITTLYGQRDALHPSARGHSGLDIADKCDTPIFAYAGGEVTRVVAGTEAKSTNGNFVYPAGEIMIKHTEELSTRYYHLRGSTTYVKVGDTVSAGQMIARQWSSGHSTGCHLHFEVYKNGQLSDPIDLLHASGYDYEYMKYFGTLPPVPTGGSSGGGTPAPPGSAKEIAQKKLKAKGWGDDQFQCLDKLWTKESGWSTTAQNNQFAPGSAPIPENQAYGIPQAGPGQKMSANGSDWKTNPATQIDWGLGYIEGRYQTPCGAWAHSVANNWY